MEIPPSRQVETGEARLLAGEATAAMRQRQQQPRRSEGGGGGGPERHLPGTSELRGKFSSFGCVNSPVS